MPVMDTIKTFFKKAFFPTMYKNEMEIKAYYDFLTGYYNPGVNSDGSNWLYGMSNTGYSPILDHKLLRQNARSAYHDSVQAKAIVDRYADTVVDQGLRLEATPKSDILGISLDQAEEWSSKVSELFDLWASSKKALRDETMTFYQAQRLVEIFQQRDNDYFVRLYYSPDKSLQNPLQIGFVDPNQINGTAFTSTYGYQTNKDGIERDMAGREIAYHINVKQKDGTYKTVRVPARGPKSGKLFMIHGFQPEYAGQGRGYSRLSHALQSFEKLTDFTQAQIQKAIVQASLALYVKPSPDAPASHPFEDIARQMGAGPTSLYQSNIEGAEVAEDSDGGITSTVQPGVRYTELPEATLKQPGVGVFSLMGGEDLQAFKDTSPSTSYEMFVSAFVSHLSASVGMPIEILLMKFNQNYSASRATLIMFWRIACIYRAEMNADFNNPIYEMWLAGEIAAGRIAAPGWSDPRLRAAWLCNNWYASPMPNIDPAKTALADQMYVGMGAQTLDRVARNYNGSSGQANRAQLKREYDELPPSPFGNKGGSSNG